MIWCWWWGDGVLSILLPFFMIHDDVFGDSGDDVYVKVL